MDGLTARPPHATPALIYGTAHQAALAFSGCKLADLLAALGPEPHLDDERAAWLLDRSLAHAMGFEAKAAAALQAEALAMRRVFRLRAPPGSIRLLAVMAPGDLMVNAPLDFITRACGVQLDLVFTSAEGVLPGDLPDHDVAIVAASESAPGVLAALPAQLAGWPVPVLNDPARIARLSRDWLAGALAHAAGIRIAPTARATRAALRRTGPCALLPGGAYPVLLRPLHAHGGHGLAKIESDEDLALYLLTQDGQAFYLTQFIDYRSPDGWFRKYRVAFVDQTPYLCHMAASERWMVHYLNAGMAESATKRAAEAKAMADFAAGFARRHARAFGTLCDAVGLDYFSIDCSEAPDGALLVFEADVAAIIHSLDDPAIYPYKAAPMQRCYDAFAAMLHKRAG